MAPHGSHSRSGKPWHLLQNCLSEKCIVYFHHKLNSKWLKCYIAIAINPYLPICFLQHILDSYIFLPSASGTSISWTIHSCSFGQCWNPIGCRRWRNSHVCGCPLWHHTEAGHSPFHLSQWSGLPSCYDPNGNDHVPSLLSALVARLCYLSQWGCLPSCYSPNGYDNVLSLCSAVGARLCNLLSTEEFLKFLIY